MTLEPPRTARVRWFLSPWVAVLLAVFCYANTLSNGFTYDDKPIVRGNPRIRSLTNFKEIWLRDWWAGLMTSTPLDDPSRDRLYRPLTMYTFAVNYALHGSNAAGYHAANLLLHAAACFLVWAVTRRLFGDATLAAIAATLFAVHPIHVEAVAGIVGRGEILAALFLLLGMLALRPRDGNARLGRTALASIAFFLALLSKETAICYPLIALIVLFVSQDARRAPRRWWLMQAGCLLVPLVLYFPLRYHALEAHLIRDKLTSILMNPLNDANLWGRFHGPFTILGHYTRLLLAPKTLSCDYGLAIIDPHAGPNWMTLLGLLAAGSLGAGLLLARTRRSSATQVATVVALFVASYALISNTVLLIGVSLAERLMYWPSVVVCMGLAIGIIEIEKRWRGNARVLKLLGAALLVALAARTIVRNADWSSDLTLFTVDAAAYPKGAHLGDLLGGVLLEAAQQTDRPETRAILLDRAGAALDRALTQQPRFAIALKHRAQVYLLAGDRARAIAMYERAILLNPADHAAQQQLVGLRGDTLELRARIEQLRAAVAQDPADLESRLELGQALLDAGDFYKAVVEFESAYERAPNETAVLRAYGVALMKNLQYAQAREILGRLLELDPRDWQTHTNMVRLIADDDPAAALRHAQRAFEIMPDDLRVQVNLAEALLLNERYDEALQRLKQTQRRLDKSHSLYEIITHRISEIEKRRP